MFAKTDVNGANTEPLWAYLKDQQGGMLTSDIKWNFRCGGGGGGLGGVGRRAGGHVHVHVLLMRCVGVGVCC
jgi:hypothetical protein